jgi:hypothetical protein
MAQHMEKSMPEHLKQYINPYMQQQVVPQHLASAPGAPVGQPAHFNVRHSPLTLVPNQEPMPIVGGGQPSAQPQQIYPSQTPQQTAQPQAVAPPPEPYAFITNPQSPKQPSLSLLSLLNGKSIMARIAVLGGGLVVLLVLFTVVKGLFAGSFNLTSFLAVLQDQQELIHLTTSSPGNQSLSAPYQNFVATTQVTVTSAQGQLSEYLFNNKQKIKPQELYLKVNPITDTQLTNAVASNTYTSTFQQIMSSQLNTYVNDLHQAYLKTSGKKGRAQLTSDFSQALLLDKQLKQAQSASGS